MYTQALTLSLSITLPLPDCLMSHLSQGPEGAHSILHLLFKSLQPGTLYTHTHTRTHSQNGSFMTLYKHAVDQQVSIKQSLVFDTVLQPGLQTRPPSNK